MKYFSMKLSFTGYTFATKHSLPNNNMIVGVSDTQTVNLIDTNLNSLFTRVWHLEECQK